MSIIPRKRIGEDCTVCSGVIGFDCSDCSLVADKDTGEVIYLKPLPPVQEAIQRIGEEVAALKRHGLSRQERRELQCYFEALARESWAEGE